MGATRILIAEDETIIRLDLARMLAAAGFNVCAEARDGLEAVELAAATAPDVAILDVKMPQLDGLEAARRIHRGAAAARVAADRLWRRRPCFPAQRTSAPSRIS